MALLKFRRSAVPAKAPTIADLELGEVALNTFDGKMYMKKDDGTQAIVEIGAAGGGGLIATSGLTMATDRILGRTTASTGAVEEITVGSGLSLSAGVLSGTGGMSAVKLSADATTTSATAVDITGLAFIPAANKTYWVEAMLLIQHSTLASNFKIGISWPTGLVMGRVIFGHTARLSLNDTVWRNGDEDQAEVTSAATYLSGGLSLGSNTFRLMRISGIVVAGATPSGSVQLRFAANGTTTSTVGAGSFLAYAEI
jgi:hypothetical protein